MPNEHDTRKHAPEKLKMKNHLKKLWKHCLTVTSSPLTWLLVIVFAAALFMFISDAAKNLTLWRAMSTLPEPERCALCEGRSLSSGLNLLRLDTGEAVPRSELDGGAPSKGASCISPGLYCRECRAKIGEAINESSIALERYVWVYSYGGGVIYISPFAD